MTTLNSWRTLVAACLAAGALMLPTLTHADINDYEFRVPNSNLRTGDQTIDVQLVSKKTGKPVPDAVIFAKRLDMAPDGMAEMDTKIVPVSSTLPGTHRFEAYFSMAGQWQLSLAAKIQGETGTLQQKLLIRAEK